MGINKDSKFIKYILKNYPELVYFYSENLSDQVINKLDQLIIDTENKYKFKVINNKLYVFDSNINNNKYIEVIKIDNDSSQEVLSAMIDLGYDNSNIEEFLSEAKNIAIKYNNTDYLISNNKLQLVLNDIDNISSFNIIRRINKKMFDYIYKNSSNSKDILDKLVNLLVLIIVLSLGISNNKYRDLNDLKKLSPILIDMDIINNIDIHFNTGIDIVDDNVELDIFNNSSNKVAEEENNYQLDILNKIYDATNNKEIIAGFINRYDCKNSYKDISYIAGYFKLNSRVINSINDYDYDNIRDILKEVSFYDKSNKLISLKEIFNSNEEFNKSLFIGSGSLKGIKNLVKILVNDFSNNTYKIVDKDNILFSGNNYRFMIKINSLDKIINTIKSYGSMRYNGKLLFPVLVHKRSENILFEVSDKNNISNKDELVKYLSDKVIAIDSRHIFSEDKMGKDNISEYVLKTGLIDSRYSLSDASLNRDTSQYIQEETLRIINGKVDGSINKYAKAFNIVLNYINVPVDYIISKIDDNFYMLDGYNQLNKLDEIICSYVLCHKFIDTTEDSLVNLVLMYVMTAKYDKLDNIVITDNSPSKDNKYGHIINAIKNGTISVPNGLYLPNLIGTIINIKDYNDARELVFEANTRLYDLLDMAKVEEKDKEESYII